MNRTRRKHKRKGGSIKSNARKKISTQTKKVFAYCPICIERIHKEDRAETICGHFFHRKCINAWCLSKVNSEEDCECPVCRSYLFDMTNLAKNKIEEKKRLDNIPIVLSPAARERMRLRREETARQRDEERTHRQQAHAAALPAHYTAHAAAVAAAHAAAHVERERRR
jgi:hypothetical protein